MIEKSALWHNLPDQLVVHPPTDMKYDRELLQLEPFFFSEIGKHRCYYQEHQNQNGRITPWRLKLRHEPEVHPVQPCQEGEGDKDGGDDRQDLDHFVELVAKAREVGFEQ